MQVVVRQPSPRCKQGRAHKKMPPVWLAGGM